MLPSRAARWVIRFQSRSRERCHICKHAYKKLFAATQQLECRFLELLLQKALTSMAHLFLAVLSLVPIHGLSIKTNLSSARMRTSSGPSDGSRVMLDRWSASFWHLVPAQGCALARL